MNFYGTSCGWPKPSPSSDLKTLLRDFMMHIAMLTLPLMAGILLVGVLANLIQVRFLFSTDTLKPNFGKLNPLPGFKRFVSVKSLIELVKGVIKIIIVGWCSFSVIHSHLDQLMGMSQMGFVQAWTVIWGIAMSICWAIAIALLVIGIADWWLQRYQLMKQLRMTKQEVKDEMKNSEGNPEVKRKVKNAGRMLMRKRMLKAVPQADVIVTNPTHFAVAIQYDPDLAPAPRVVAKGADHMAFKIREIAQENGIPILENKPLARGLYAAVEVDHMIPPDMFIAVAEVLAYVYKRNKGRGAARMRRIKKGGL